MGIGSNAAKRGAAVEARETEEEPRLAEWLDALHGRSKRNRRMLLITAVLIGGIVIGAALMQQRYKATDAIVAINSSIIDQWFFHHRLEADYGPNLLRQIADERLLEQFAKQRGMSPTDQELRAKFAEDSAQHDFDTKLAQSHQTEADYKYHLAITLARIKLLSRGVTVTDADIHKYYQVNTDPKNVNARYYTPDTVQVAVITVPTEAEMRNVQQVLGQGNPFEEVARTYSKDVSGTEGGLMPVIARGRTNLAKIPHLEDLIFSLKVGQISEPQHISNIWWIIKCVDRHAASTAPFSSVKLDCRYALMLNKGMALNGKQLEADFRLFKKKSNILVFWPDYEGVITQN